MAEDAPASPTAATTPRYSPVPLWSRAKFLCLHVFCAAVVDLWPRLLRLCTGAAFRAERAHVYGAPEARAPFRLDAFDGMPYPDPPCSGHAATILCAFRPHHHIQYRRLTHRSSDRNPMCVDWFLTRAFKAKGVFVIVPGLASSSATNYIEHFVWFAAAHDFHCVVFNSRGMGDTKIETPRLMSGQWTDDVRTLAASGPLSRAAIAETCGVAGLPIVGIGFSLGGVILSKYAAEECLAGRPLSMDAVMIVNSPLDCIDSSTRMSRGISKVLYQPSMVRGLVAYARRHAAVLPKLPGLAPEVHAAFAAGLPELVLGKVKSVRDFDMFITAPTLGFASPEAYYSHISPVEWLPHIQVPVLCISAADDPVTGVPPMQRMRSIMDANRNVALLIFPHGGHIGYVRGFVAEWGGSETVMERTVFAAAAAVVAAQG